MSNLQDIARTASQIISVVGPIIRVAQAGSPVAQKIADALDVAGNYLRFGDKLVGEHLAEVQKDLEDIRKEVTEMASHGDSVPQDKWDAVHTDITSSADRIRAAMGLKG